MPQVRSTKKDTAISPLKLFALNGEGLAEMAILHPKEEKGISYRDAEVFREEAGKRNLRVVETRESQSWIMGSTEKQKFMPEKFPRINWHSRTMQGN